MNNIELIDKPIEKNSYIVKETTSDRVFDLVAEKMDSGSKCLCITRTNPIDIKRRYNIDLPIVWLTNQTNQKNKDSQTTSNMGVLKTKIKEFIKKNDKPIVLLDRIDYLINMHGFTNVLKFIYSVNDEVTMNDSTLMLNVNPNTLSPQELNLLEQELQELPRPKSELESELPDDLHEIIIFVNNSEKVSFKDVSKKFSITKTTTRKRINRLEEKGLVVIKKNGRNKIVKMTDFGRTAL
jgi:uncharacterized membrane protein